MSFCEWFHNDLTHTIGVVFWRGFTDLSNSVLLIWFSVFACFGVSFYAVSPSVYLDDIKLGLDTIAEWPTFGRELLIRLPYFLFVI